jgi:hypothetical protein
MNVVQPFSTRLPASQARELLRRLRDLNLADCPVAIHPNSHVTLDGCLSLDAPVEQGVRYRVRHDDGSLGTFTIECNQTHIDLTSEGRSLSTAIMLDGAGRACAPELGARVTPSCTEPRTIEHFLRRAVRALY